jgi:thioredoxin-related protein
MRKLLLAALSLLSLIAVGAVNFGDSLETVIAGKGQPDNTLSRGNITILTYSDAVIRLEDGKVVDLKDPNALPGASSSSNTKSGGVGTTGQWTTDYASALAGARGTDRKILLFFTGSDWCGWCKRLDAEVLSTSDFRAYARQNLVLVKLDFPQGIPQSAQLKRQNRELGDKYGIDGYPTVIVLNSSGGNIGKLGYMAGGPAPFIARIKQY